MQRGNQEMTLGMKGSMAYQILVLLDGGRGVLVIVLREGSGACEDPGYELLFVCLCGDGCC